jgi:hypothetical protein
MRGISTSRFVAVVAALVVATGAVTTVWAAGPADSGAITGCYAKKGGKLRVVDAGKKCKKSERSIAWSETGPAGAPGAPGPRGAAGAKGEKGAKGDPGRMGPVYGAEGFELLDNEVSREVVELALPAGSYVLFGTGVASNDAEEAGQVSCLIGSIEAFVGQVNQTVPAHGAATFTAQRAVELSSDDTITAWCMDTIADEAVWLAMTMTAVPVGNIVW